jgi:hypothetical protein
MLAPPQTSIVVDMCWQMFHSDSNSPPSQFCCRTGGARQVVQYHPKLISLTEAWRQSCRPSWRDRRRVAFSRSYSLKSCAPFVCDFTSISQTDYTVPIVTQTRPKRVSASFTAIVRTSLHTSIFASAQQCTTGTQPSELADHSPLAYDPSAAEVRTVGCLTSQHRADKDLARVVWSAYGRHLTLLPAMRLETANVCNAVLPSCHSQRQTCAWLTLICRAGQISLTTIRSHAESTRK